jgi:hypothetical protein
VQRATAATISETQKTADARQVINTREKMPKS